MQLLFDFLPLIAFFAAYVIYDLYVATATIMVVIALQIAYQWFRHRKVNKMLLISGVLVAVFGGITLILRDPVFIQWKVTVVNWLFAAAFLGSQLFGPKTFTERLMGHAASSSSPDCGGSSTFCGSSISPCSVHSISTSCTTSTSRFGCTSRRGE